ncbi:MAG: hypothetical protein IPP13_11830 [Kouleothrix sp.]|nr:hypothetical protein [Kouleothrix sp.]
MPQPPGENHLADRRYVSLVLRLVLDQHGQMIHGEVVGDANARPTRFSGWRGLTRAVQIWLAHQEQDGTADEPTTP